LKAVRLSRFEGIRPQVLSKPKALNHRSLTPSDNPFGFVSPYLNAETSRHKFLDFVVGKNDFSGNQPTDIPDRKVSGCSDLEF